MSSKSAILLRRKYTMADQQLFATLSGDFNPLHLDAVAARRTLVGAPAVHGVNLALTAWELLLEREPDRRYGGVAAQFPRPVLVEDVVTFAVAETTSDRVHVRGTVSGNEACRFVFKYTNEMPGSRGGIPSATPNEPLVDANFDEVIAAKGELPVGMDPVVAAQLFARISSNAGGPVLAEMLALTRLVGMRCPGLHSLFSGFDITFHGEGSPGVLRYTADKPDNRFRKVELAVQGATLHGRLTVFVRPAPESQPTTAVVAKRVEPGLFADSAALIIGGSRGLGEITAKIIAAGGGFPIVTYHQGVDDAKRVVEDIRAWGGRCEMVQLDVGRGAATVKRLFRGKKACRSLYYFATPRIFGPRRRFFDHEQLRAFNEIYVTAFGQVVDAAISSSQDKVRIFYPSSTAVTENLREMAEYALSKRTAEELCASYNRYSERAEIVVERLPRLKTDQTLTLLPIPAEDPLDVMLPLVLRTEKKARRLET